LKNSSGVLKSYFFCKVENKPSLDRKSGIPELVEIPAPVKNEIFLTKFYISKYK